MTEDGADAELEVDEAGRGASAGAVVDEASPTGADFVAWVSLMLGCSKSQETPCLEQFPQRGCTSSHLIFLTLHRLQPALDFLWDLLGGIVE